MTIKHLANDKLLMGYAAGVLPEAFNLVVSAHLSISDESRARLAGFEAVGGGILEDQEQVEMSDDALDAVFDKISDNSPVFAKSKAKSDDNIFPTALQKYVGGDVESVKWKSLGMGVKQAILPTSKGAQARLLFIPAGCEVPDHGHRGTELTLVLKGAFSDEVDRFARGDLEIANEDLEHAPRAEDGEDCICLTATDAPLRFNSLLPRILQPIFKI